MDDRDGIIERGMVLGTDNPVSLSDLLSPPPTPEPAEPEPAEPGQSQSTD